MKKIIKYFPILFLSLLFTSCLDAGLDELPTFSENDIVKMYFEYRWTDADNAYGRMDLIKLNCAATIDTTANTVDCVLTVPAAKGSFTEAIRAEVSIKNIVAYADISTAAIMSPVGDAPVLGIPGDFSKTSMQYLVEAANGDKETWTLTVSEFNK